MPKQVDREARRRDVVDALFRVVAQHGLQRASLRTVAAEAGLNVGSVRHYFAGQQELMRFAMQSMLDRVAERGQALVEEAGDDLERLSPQEQRRHTENVLCELLPLDERRRAEVTVFIDFVTTNRTTPGLEDLAHETAVGARRLMRRLLTRLDDSGALRSGLDLDVEAERLASLLDGLSLNAVLRPELVDEDRCLAVLKTHLDALEPAPQRTGR